MGVTHFLLLSCLGLATTAEAQDCGRPVGGPNMRLKDEYILLETFSDKSSASFTCEVGYVSVGGSASITCTAGSWSPVRLICEKKNCGSAGEVEHGHIDYSEGTEFGSKIVITCDTGYRFVGKPGPREIFCGDKGWNDRLPVCEVVTCDRPPADTSATLSPDKDAYNYREVVHYSCPKGLSLIGVNSITCSHNGTFDPDPNPPPTCKRVECRDIDIENADWTGGSRPPYGFKDMVTFKCRSGYTMEGEGTLKCGENNEWSPEPPTCRRSATTVKPKVSTTTASPGNKGHRNDYVMPLVICLIVFAIGALTACGCYCFGVPAFIKKKKGSGKDTPDSEAPKPEEEVPLS